MVTYPYKAIGATLALAVITGIVLLITVPVAAGAVEAEMGERVAAAVAAVLTTGGVAFVVVRLRRRTVVLDPGRVGRSAGVLGGEIVWCDLDQVVLATTSRFAVRFGGVQRNLVLWVSSGGVSGLGRAIARLGMDREQKEAVGAAERDGPLRSFVVPLTGLASHHASAVLVHVSSHEPFGSGFPNVGRRGIDDAGGYRVQIGGRDRVEYVGPEGTATVVADLGGPVVGLFLDHLEWLTPERRPPTTVEAAWLADRMESGLEAMGRKVERLFLRIGGSLPVDASRHEETHGRLRGVLIRVSDQLDPTTVRVVDDLIEAAEGPIALDMMSEMLVEADARLDREVIGEIALLAGTLGLPPETVERLLPLS